MRQISNRIIVISYHYHEPLRPLSFAITPQSYHPISIQPATTATKETITSANLGEKTIEIEDTIIENGREMIEIKDTKGKKGTEEEEISGKGIIGEITGEEELGIGDRISTAERNRSELCMLPK